MPSTEKDEHKFQRCKILINVRHYIDEIPCTRDKMFLLNYHISNKRDIPKVESL